MAKNKIIKKKSGNSEHNLYTGEFLIDKITNSIQDKRTGISFTTDIIPVTSGDIKVIYKKDGWKFNWKKEYQEVNHQVYKLLIHDNNIIQGLISLEPVKKDLFIEMHLIETAPQNYGKKKIYLGVPGNLVAFACKMSFEMGLEGYVVFNAKSKLITHYEKH